MAIKAKRIEIAEYVTSGNQLTDVQIERYRQLKANLKEAEENYYHLLSIEQDMDAAEAWKEDY